MVEPSSASDPTLVASLMEMLSAAQITQAVSVMARLEIADILCDGPLPVETIAARCDAHGPTLRRLLRALATVDMVHESDDGRFSTTPKGDLLRSDHPRSCHALVDVMGDPFVWNAWADLIGAVRTGTCAFELVHGNPILTICCGTQHCSRGSRPR